MKTIAINGKTYTDAQLRTAIRKHVKDKDRRPLTTIMDEVPPEGTDPEYQTMILSIQDDPVARKLATEKLERGIDGFGAIDPMLNVAEFLVDIYLRFRKKR